MKPFDTHTPEINAALKELQEGIPLLMEVGGLEALLLHGLLQLAQRHPHLPDISREYAQVFSQQLKGWLGQDKRLLLLLNAGEDVRQDEACLPEVVVEPGQIPAVYIVLTEKSDGEYFVVAGDRDTGNQVVTEDPQRIPELRDIARRAAAYANCPARVVRFFGRDVIEEILP